MSTRPKTVTPSDDSKIYAIYTDFSPRYPDILLGFIYADNELVARHRVHDKGLMRYTTAFQPRVVEVSRKERNALYAIYPNLLKKH